MSEVEHAAKRQKSNTGAPSPTTPTESTIFTAAAPEATIDIYPDGDTILIVPSIANVSKCTGLRVSSHVLSLTSPVFKRLILDSFDAHQLSTSDFTRIHLPTDDGDALLLLCNALHLRNDTLPSRVPPELLLQYVAIAAKYGCAVAASRAATPWFDHIYYKRRDALVMGMIEAAAVLDDPVWFARFTTKWVCSVPLGNATAEEMRAKRFGMELLARQKDAVNSLKADLDLLVDKLAEALSTDVQHCVDCAPGDEPDPDTNEEEQEGATQCTVDRGNATEILAALRDANIWPATRWPNNVSAIIRLIAGFELPKYDSSEQCVFCLRVEDGFVKILALVRGMHEERLWGLCLDCYKAGGLYQGECRVEHIKPKVMPESAVKRVMSGDMQVEGDEGGEG